MKLNSMGETKRFTPRVYLEFAAIMVACIIFFAVYVFQTPWIPEADGFYHIKFAQLLRSQGFFRDFKWASVGVWSERFCDTSFLFHLILIPFTFFENLQTGAKLAIVCIGATTFCSFYWILRLNHIRHAWIWLVMLSSGGTLFLFRVSVCRPQVISLCLLLWSMHFILNKKIKCLWLVGILYPLTYMGGILPIIFSLVFILAQWVTRDKMDWKLPAVAAGAFAIGLILHPYFPHQFLYFYLINLYIFSLATLGADALRMGVEFYPVSTSQMLLNHPSIVVPLFASFFTSMVVPRKSDAKILGLFLMSTLLLILTAFSKRYAEYSIPVTLLFCAFYFDSHVDRLKAWFSLASVRQLLWISLGFGLGLGGIFINSHTLAIPKFKGIMPSAWEEPALYLKTHARKDDIVFTCDWDDAPELFFFTSDQRYLIFLDPSFFFFKSPELWRLWSHVSMGGAGAKTVDVLGTSFGAKWVACSWEFDGEGGIKQILKNDRRAHLVVDTGKTFLFELR